MFPRKAGAPTQQKRERGAPKPGTTFRMPADMLAYVAQVEALGYNRTEVILRMMAVARDVADGLGPEWFDLEKLAAMEGTSPGGVLARLARVGLEVERLAALEGASVDHVQERLAQMRQETERKRSKR